MRSLFVDSKNLYDGAQLTPLHNYLVHDVLGDSIVAWVGPCQVTLDHMIDGEDLKVKSAIAGDSMLHMVLEIFHQSLHAGVLLQRLIGEIVRTQILAMGDSEKGAKIFRQGDDLYWGSKKLNISIATCSANSFLIHFGINVTNAGTPVETCALEDFGITDGKVFGVALIAKIAEEVGSQIRATQKVRTF